MFKGVLLVVLCHAHVVTYTNQEIVFQRPSDIVIYSFVDGCVLLIVNYYIINRIQCHYKRHFGYGIKFPF